MFKEKPCYLAQFDSLKLNSKVATSQGKIYHCPKPECKGLVHSAQFQLFQLKVSCATCQSSVCSSCKGLWHEGTKCSKEDGTQLQWDALGNLNKGGTANRCPKCRAPFEKNGGCPHMQCLMCLHHWCWVCGLDPTTRCHTTMAGLCGAIGYINFGIRKWPVCLIYLLEFLFALFYPGLLLILTSALYFCSVPVMIALCLKCRLDQRRPTR